VRPTDVVGDDDGGRVEDEIQDRELPLHRQRPAVSMPLSGGPVRAGGATDLCQKSASAPAALDGPLHVHVAARAPGAADHIRHDHVRKTLRRRQRLP